MGETAPRSLVTWLGSTDGAIESTSPSDFVVDSEFGSMLSLAPILDAPMLGQFLSVLDDGNSQAISFQVRDGAGGHVSCI